MEKFNEEDCKNHQSAAGFFASADGRILVQKHVKHNMLTLPVGKCKANETPIQGLCTEMREELGVEIKDAVDIISFRKVYDFTGNKVLVDMHVFKVEDYYGTIANMEPEKCSGLMWLTKEELRNSGETLSDCLKMLLAWL